jgi:hypothetical protein
MVEAGPRAIAERLIGFGRGEELFGLTAEEED